MGRSSGKIDETRGLGRAKYDVVLRNEASRDIESLIGGLVDRPDAARRFVDSVDRVVGRLRDFPLSSPVVYNPIRRAIVPGTRYMLLYFVQENLVVIVACMDARRDPKEIFARAN